ncbi:protein VAPYRIN-LIKE-like [Nicotiana sylvestris]|uniref:Ankyrin repeat, PH and SEC7 domain containing protein secG-like n=1 Tax=Nicotiana sylvestris TaxID=4096 RepID=A0A1U7XN62_NICSY|nr:PREDICTED: ankyrin repeat, PH and SEC7 domain containing protein secG-like [Nicotiana sylvestris]
MDRLIKPDIEEFKLCFIRGQKSSATFKLTSLMHTMSVAVCLSTTKPSVFSFSHPFSIIPPLSTASFTLFLTNSCDQPPLSTPLDTVTVKSSMLPTGKATQDDLRRLFSRTGRHIFKDAKIPISLVGPQVVEFLLSPTSSVSSNTLLDVSLLLPKALSLCDGCQLDSLLKSATKNGNSHCISALIEAGADVNRRDSDGDSVMSLAVKSGNLDSVQVLIESGYTVGNSVDRFLHDAAAMDRVDLMEILCLGYADIDLNSVDSQGRTAIHIAAIYGHVEVLQFLISVGSDPDMLDSQGWTPLHFAANQGHVEAVDFLLKHSNFAKFAVTKQGKTASELATDNGHSELYDILQLGDALHRAARKGDVVNIKKHMAEGANVNRRDQNGWTPLHRAAFKGEIEGVKVLVKHGAKLDVVDDCGYTPLHLAIEAGQKDVAVYLVAQANLKSFKDKGLVSCDLDYVKNHPSHVHTTTL